MLHPANLDSEALLRECRVERTRGSGPGGQRRNVTETAVRLTHLPTGLTAHGDERRSQAENLAAALRRLRVTLAVEHRSQVDPHGRISDLLRSRLRDGRIVLNPRHHDFPPILAEALDMLAATGHDPARAAAALGCSTSQLLRLLRHEGRALAKFNEERARRGLRPMS